LKQQNDNIQNKSSHFPSALASEQAQQTLSVLGFTFYKQQVATAIAILFHAIGLVGILFFKNDLIIRSTPLNLLLMLVLLLWTQAEKNTAFILFALLAIMVGITVELIGVNTGLLFGNYKYGNVLGFNIKGVPLVIGINWFVIIYCCGVSITTLMQKAINKLAEQNQVTKKPIKALSVIIDGATLAVFFDWLMEPAAVKLGFWQWEGDIPMYNYICWFGTSTVLLAVFHFCKFNKANKFAIHLLMIQAMFFLLLRTFLPQ
jgi:bisanhydrobacterioruberin hydratase